MATFQAKAFLLAAAVAAAAVLTGPVDAGAKRGRGAPDFSKVDLRSPALKAAEAWRKRGMRGAARPAFEGRFISPTVSVNNRAADITDNDIQVVPSIVDMGLGRLVAAFADSGSDPGTGPVQVVGFSTSANSGASWTDRGALPVTPLGDNSNPMLAADRGANLVYLAVSDATNFDTVQVFKSTDFGQSFGATPVNGLPGFVDTGEQLDGVHIAVDNFAGAGQGNVYVCATDFFLGGNEIRLSRSTNQGATFLPDHSDLPPPVAVGATGCKIVVSPNHQVNVFYFRGRGFANGDNRLFVRRSSDFGATFGPEVEIADLATKTPFGGLQLRNELDTISLALPAVNPNPLKPFLYAVFNDDPDLANLNDNGAIYMVQSLDGGATWSPPILVDNAKGDQFAPAIGIQPGTGRLMVSWSTTSDDPTGRMFHRQARMGLIAANGSVTFFNDFRLGPNTPPTNGFEGFSGDTVGGSGNMQAVWSDSRFGNAFHVRQTDIFHARIANPPQAGDLSVTGGFTPATVGLGQTALLNLTVTAAGAAQADVLAAISFDKATARIVSVVPSAGRCDIIDGFVTCNFGAIPAGASRTIALTAMPLIFTGAQVASINVTTSNADANLANNTLAKTLTVVSGGAVGATVSTGSIAVAIPEEGTVEVPVSFPSTGTVVNIRPHFRLDHAFDGDLTISLVAPTGETTVLANGVGGSGQNFGSGANDCTGTRTLFDELAPTPIGAGTAPFAGTFKPDETLLNVMGIPSAGTWKLRIVDTSTPDGGTVGCFKITLIRRP